MANFPVTINDNGTITRNFSSFLPSTAATPDPHDNHTVALSKDVTVNQSNNTWVRIHLPRQSHDSSSSPAKLPLIVHFHGGGFVMLSAATSMYHDLCSNIAIQLPAVVVSVEYRLAPEHRLPAAYDDAMEVLHWLKSTQEDWVRKFADLRSCFLMGDSSGGNIAYHTALLAAAEVDKLVPMTIRGLILYKPFFSGIKRTESEVRLENDPDFPLAINDMMWQLSLPLGVDRDHEYCNPTVRGGSKNLDKIRSLGLKVMVSGGFGDPLVDRQIELLKLLEQKGVKVEGHFDDSGHRMKDFTDPEKRKALYGCVKDFVLSSTTNA